jgi:hypothetical protein
VRLNSPARHSTPYFTGVYGGGAVVDKSAIWRP